MSRILMILLIDIWYSDIITLQQSILNNVVRGGAVEYFFNSTTENFNTTISVLYTTAKKTPEFLCDR